MVIADLSAGGTFEQAMTVVAWYAVRWALKSTSHVASIRVF